MQGTSREGALKRTTQKFTITTTNTIQPLVGTTTSAATGPGGTDPNGDSAVVTVAVTSSAMFLNGDWAIIGSIANGDEERVFVQKVKDSTHINVKGMTKTHVNGSFVRLAVLCQAVYVQTTQGNTGAIYLGTQSMVESTQVGVFAILYPFASPTQPIDYTDPYRVSQDGGDVGEYWITGTSGDGFIPSLTII
jgi:hypothetical protein